MGKSFRDLIAWQKGMILVTEVYAATSHFPRYELFGLTSQIRRAAVSIPSNIAEGHGRMTNADRRHFLYQARGSSLELQTQIEIAKQLGYLKIEVVCPLELLADEVGRIINGLLRSLTPQ